MTQDGRTLSIRSIVTCRVTGPKTAATTCEAIQETIQSQGIRAQNHVVAGRTFADIQGDGLDKLLLSEVAERLKPYGIRVTAASIEVGETHIRHHLGLEDTIEAEL